MSLPEKCNLGQDVAGAGQEPVVRDAKMSGKTSSTGCKSSSADSLEPPGEKGVLLM